jgi:exopolysaccharide/PEP-CTERM locus tyrosine autokinase
LGKIFDALEKFRKERGSSVSGKLRNSDYDLLLRFDEKTGRLETDDASAIKDSGGLRRLMTYRLVDSEGRLTPAGIAKLQELRGRYKDRKPAKPVPPGTPEEQAPSAESGQKKVKIISFEEDEQTVKMKAEEVRPKHVSTPAYKTPHAVPKPDKSPKKNDLQIPRHAAPAAGPPKSPAAGRFVLKKSTAKYDKNAIDKNLVSLFNPESYEAEQFKILRTNLLFPTSGESPRSIMVTSALPDEGKSFVAANLAVSVARHINRSVLLIDCDLRRPSIQRQFGFGDTPGLGDYLSRGTELPSLLLKTSVDHLTILPAGRPPSNPSELLSSERMYDLLEEVSTRYPDRLIIIDSPPPRLAAESGALARQVDGILVVVKYASTPRDMVTELIDKLGPDKVLGAIVNSFEMSSPFYAKRYYGYYGKPYRQKS